MNALAILLSIVLAWAIVTYMKPKRLNVNTILICAIFVCGVLYLMYGHNRKKEFFANAVPTQCPADISEFINGTRVLDLSNIASYYVPGTGSADQRNPDQTAAYKTTTKNITDFKRLCNRLEDTPGCESSFMLLFDYMANTNAMLGKKPSPQGNFEGLTALTAMWTSMISFVTNNQTMYPKMQKSIAWLSKLTDMLGKGFSKRTNNTLLLSLIPQGCSAVMNKKSLKPIADRLMKQMTGNFDDGFVVSEEWRGAQLAHYNLYYMGFLTVLFLIFNESKYPFPFLKYKTDIYKVLDRLNDPSSYQHGIPLYTEKYKNVYPAKYKKPLPNINRLGGKDVFFAKNMKLTFDYIYTGGAVPDMEFESGVQSIKLVSGLRLWKLMNDLKK
jgi:hypothetical protein